MHRPMVLLASLLVGLWVSGCARDPATQINRDAPAGTGLLDKSVVVDGAEMKFRVFVPLDYRPNAAPRPAIVFLHGLMERGTDGRAMTSVGIAPVIARDPSRWPFIVIFPQTTDDWKSPGSHRRALAALDATLTEYRVNPDRVILTGLSIGGEGTWRLGAAHRNRFAALVPIAGYAALDVAPQLVGIPIWAFHNRRDWAVSAHESRKMVEAIRAAGGEIRYTEPPAAGHNAWDTAYDRDDLINWMFNQRRGR